MNQHYASSRIEAEKRIALGDVRVVHNVWSEPIDIVARPTQRHHVELTLLPISRNAKARFVDHWRPNRFEPMGRMFLLPAHHTIHACSDCRQQNSISCSFDPAAIERWFDRRLAWTDHRLRGTLDIASNRIRNLLFSIGEETRVPGFANETMLELMAAQLAIELSRHLTGIDDEGRAGGLSPWRLRLIEQRLTEESAPPSLTELATLCGLSVRHLARAFRTSRSRSLGSYIAEHRLNHAKRMLADGMSIKSVAFSTGFSAPSNFTAAFVRATGETPRQYRQRHSGR